MDIDTGRQTALAVPLSAMTDQNGAKGVLVADKGMVRFRKVSLGLKTAAGPR